MQDGLGDPFGGVGGGGGRQCGREGVPLEEGGHKGWVRKYSQVAEDL